ncbi:zinc finger protein 638 [Spea bombifrons]|uniref:zinc finger protein 638 n=1 Tax=Spea bombifrons TaxID=233779 RepID=UPI00234B5994|nr:zinc finger protein 638 [Spea bombifrons]
MFTPRGGFPAQGPRNMMNPRMNQPGMNLTGMNVPGMNQQGMGLSGMNQQGMGLPGMNQQGMGLPGMNQQGMGLSGMNRQGISSPGMNHPNVGIGHSGIGNPGMSQAGMNLNRMNHPGMNKGGGGGGGGFPSEMRNPGGGLRPHGMEPQGSFGGSDSMGMKGMPIRAPLERGINPQSFQKRFVGSNPSPRPVQPRVQPQNQELSTLLNMMAKQSSSDIMMGKGSLPLQDSAHMGKERPWEGPGSFKKLSQDMSMKPLSNQQAQLLPDQQNRYTNESASSILESFGLSNEDLEELSRYPDDQLTPANMPVILRDIRLRKMGRSGNPSDQSGARRSGGEVLPSKVIDYGHSSKYQFGGDSVRPFDSSRAQAKDFKPGQPNVEPKKINVSKEPATPANIKSQKPADKLMDNKIPTISVTRKNQPAWSKVDRSHNKTVFGEQPEKSVGVSTPDQSVKVMAQPDAPAMAQRDFQSASHPDAKPDVQAGTLTSPVTYQGPPETSPADPSNITKGNWPPALPHHADALKKMRTPTPSMMNDYYAASPRIFPHICSLCNIECRHLKDWIKHQNTPAHIESCRQLRLQYPDWNPQVLSSLRNEDKKSDSVPSKRSKSNSPSQRRSKRSGSRHRARRSRSRSPRHSGRARSRSRSPRRSRPRRSRSPRRRSRSPRRSYSPRRPRRAHSSRTHSSSPDKKAVDAAVQNFIESTKQRNSADKTKPARPSSNGKRASPKSPGSTAKAKKPAGGGTKITSSGTAKRTSSVSSASSSKKSSSSGNPAKKPSGSDATSPKKSTDGKASGAVAKRVVTKPSSAPAKKSPSSSSATDKSSGSSLSDKKSGVKKPPPNKPSAGNKKKNPSATEAFNPLHKFKNKSNPGTVIHVSNLPDSGYTDQDILKIVQPFGKVCDILIIRSKNEAYLETNFKEAAAAAVKFSETVPMMVNNTRVTLRLAGEKAPEKKAEVKEKAEAKETRYVFLFLFSLCTRQTTCLLIVLRVGNNRMAQNGPQSLRRSLVFEQTFPQISHDWQQWRVSAKLTPSTCFCFCSKKPTPEEGFPCNMLLRDLSSCFYTRSLLSGNGTACKDFGSLTCVTGFIFFFSVIPPGFVKRYKLAAPKLKDSEKCVVMISNLPEAQSSVEEISNLAKPFGGITDILFISTYRKAYLQLTSKNSVDSMLKFYDVFPTYISGNALSISMNPKFKDIKDEDRVFAELIEEALYEITPNIYEKFVHLGNLPEKGYTEFEIVCIGLRFGKVEHYVVFPNKRKAILHMCSAKAANAMHRFLSQYPCSVGDSILSCSLPSKTALEQDEYMTVLEEEKKSAEAETNADETETAQTADEDTVKGHTVPTKPTKPAPANGKKGADVQTPSPVGSSGDVKATNRSATDQNTDLQQETKTTEPAEEATEPTPRAAVERAPSNPVLSAFGVHAMTGEEDYDEEEAAEAPEAPEQGAPEFVHPESMVPIEESAPYTQSKLLVSDDLEVLVSVESEEEDEEAMDQSSPANLESVAAGARTLDAIGVAASDEIEELEGVCVIAEPCLDPAALDEESADPSEPLTESADVADRDTCGVSEDPKPPEEPSVEQKPEQTSDERREEPENANPEESLVMDVSEPQPAEPPLADSRSTDLKEELVCGASNTDTFNQTDRVEDNGVTDVKTEDDSGGSTAEKNKTSMPEKTEGDSSSGTVETEKDSVSKTEDDLGSSQIEKVKDATPLKDSELGSEKNKDSTVSRTEGDLGSRPAEKDAAPSKPSEGSVKESKDHAGSSSSTSFSRTAKYNPQKGDISVTVTLDGQKPSSKPDTRKRVSSERSSGRESSTPKSSSSRSSPAETPKSNSKSGASASLKKGSGKNASSKDDKELKATPKPWERESRSSNRKDDRSKSSHGRYTRSSRGNNRGVKSKEEPMEDNFPFDLDEFVTVDEIVEDQTDEKCEEEQPKETQSANSARKGKRKEHEKSKGKTTTTGASTQEPSFVTLDEVGDEEEGSPGPESTLVQEPQALLTVDEVHADDEHSPFVKGSQELMTLDEISDEDDAMQVSTAGLVSSEIPEDLSKEQVLLTLDEVVGEEEDPASNAESSKVEVPPAADGEHKDEKETEVPTAKEASNITEDNPSVDPTEQPLLTLDEVKGDDDVESIADIVGFSEGNQFFTVDEVGEEEDESQIKSEPVKKAAGRGRAKTPRKSGPSASKAAPKPQAAEKSPAVTPRRGRPRKRPLPEASTPTQADAEPKDPLQQPAPEKENADSAAQEKRNEKDSKEGGSAAGTPTKDADSTVDSCPKDSETPAKKSKLESPAKDAKLPPFNASVPIGLEFLVPKTGYFCELCSLFYMDEASKLKHCKSLRHYQSVEKHMAKEADAPEKKDGATE